MHSFWQILTFSDNFSFNLEGKMVFCPLMSKILFVFQQKGFNRNLKNNLNYQLKQLMSF